VSVSGMVVDLIGGVQWVRKDDIEAEVDVLVGEHNSATPLTGCC